MPSCPACGAPLQEDFGLVNCAACGQPTFIDMEGVAQAAGVEDSESKSQPHPQPEESQQSSHPESLKEEFSEALLSELTGVGVSEGLGTPDSSESVIAEGEAAVDVDLDEDDEVDADGGLTDHATSLDEASSSGETEEGPQVQARDPKGASLEDMSEVASFGNSNDSSSLGGPLRYCIYISGIDTSDIKRELKDSLRDKRFLWDIEDLLSQVRNGELKIDELSPVKAALIVSRIKSLPVEVRWEQYAIHKAQD